MPSRVPRPLRRRCPATQVFNDKGELLVGSHYILKDRYSVDKRLPCVIICHGNAGCRVDANGPALALLSRGITCFCFDFSGCGAPPASSFREEASPFVLSCRARLFSRHLPPPTCCVPSFARHAGLSQGEVVTLGAKEAADLHAVRPHSQSYTGSARHPPLSPPTHPGHSRPAPAPQVVQFLREQGRTANLALWGRSMGATTSLIYASQNLSIAGLVLDSPFSRLTDLIQDIVRDMTGGRAPSWIVRALARKEPFGPPRVSWERANTLANCGVTRWIGCFARAQVSGAIRILRNSLKKRCNVDINDIDALASAVEAYQARSFALASAENNSVVAAPPLRPPAALRAQLKRTCR